MPRLQLADALALVAPIGLFFGRIANFVNAELVGAAHRAALGRDLSGRGGAGPARALPLAVAPATRASFTRRGWKGWSWASFCFLLFRRGALKRPGLITGIFLIGYGLSRFAVEFVRQADAQFITPDNPMGSCSASRRVAGLSMGQLAVAADDRRRDLALAQGAGVTPLGQIIAARIAAEGPMSLSDYMAECLHEPRLRLLCHP